ncbi:hypothetical protein LRS03_25955 [Rhizobacter sp. J219]|uniref:hypothetical protein n=1 Tax=Rhizobacter sp. J219 TaxID=2898430 RepID=UPI002151EC18|nr:hypothetical protein [Rhizobacter sp. J219]MCR5886110.1 hypothetical protein [Rhizobacter sp. J219]
MKATLDHNVIIDLANDSAEVAPLRAAIASGLYEAYVVEIGASEMRQRGIQPDRYDLFEELLLQAGIAQLPRLSPMLIWDVTFWDRCIWANEEMVGLARQIEEVLFGDAKVIDIAAEKDNSAVFRTWLNRTCDVHTMWCHIHHGNDVFITSDKNFLKASKLPRLLELGAKSICLPRDA